ncbi:MAG: UvrB/UvrC motif-containing protein [Gemmatimonadota bacterium]|nr:UvrB/UvrC motif-containing protein [Gemmatimonadota bacterium]
MPDDLCDNCGSKPATVNLTQIENNEMSSYHLCEDCAAQKGLEATTEPSSSPLPDFLAQIGDEPREEEDSDNECSFCGLMFAAFRETGRLGCPHCYETFEAHLRRLLRRVHGGTKHVGKIYLPPDPTVSEIEKQMEALRRRLNRAVEAEDFERAAELRDQMRSLEPV